MIKKFTEHPIIGFFFIGFAIGIRRNPAHALEAGFCLALAGCLVWYFFKAIFITGRTIVTWDKEHPGEPMFKAGGLTEYDEEIARRIGTAAGEAAERARKRDEH